MYQDGSLGGRLTAFFAVVTLPVGILALWFATLEVAAVVFVVGWLLLVPATAVLSGPPWAEDPAEEMERLAAFQDAAAVVQERSGSEDGGDGSDRATARGEDPLDALRNRYARGDIDEAEFERGLNALLETEDLDADVERRIERAADGLDGDGERGHGSRDDGESRSREPERE
jgi:hypothetical protein